MNHIMNETDKVRTVIHLPRQWREVLRAEARLRNCDMGDIVLEFLMANLPDTLEIVKRRRAQHPSSPSKRRRKNEG